MHDSSSDITSAIGNTPLIRLCKTCTGEVLGKAEFLNPGGSVKDRVALHILRESARRGTLKKDDIIVEATSGNTGIGMTMIGRLMGHRVIIVMPENMSEERKKIIQALGGDLILTPAEKSLNGCLDKLEELKAELPNVFIPGQFVNPLNPEAHYLTTGPEIWKQTGGKVDVFVAGIGSGGSLMGIARYLREKNPKVEIVAVEPRNAAALLGREPGLHVIQGIGDGFVPPVVDRNIIDMVVTVTDEDAVETTRMMARNEGVLAGTSSGANVWCAQRFATHGRTVVTLLPDRAERYFSTALL